MAKRGRPPQPPRTDPKEIEKSHERLNKDVERRMAATFGSLPTLQSSPLDALRARVAGPLIQTKPLTEEERARIEAMLAADKLNFELIDGPEPGDITVKSLEGLFAVPEKLTEEEREARLAQTRARMAAQGADARKHRRGRKQPDFATQAKRILPTFPQWIRDAAFDSILYLYDEAPESMRPSIERLNPELPKIRHALFARDLPIKIAKKVAALWDQIRCTAWTDRCDIRDPGPNGIRAAYIHYINVEQKMRKFVATCEVAPDGRVRIPRDIALRLFVPAFNATHSDRRRCLECAAIFALRNDYERRSSKFCGGGRRCANRVSSRRSKAEARKGGGDIVGRMREHEKGDAAVERGERQMAISNPYSVEDMRLELIDAMRGKSAPKRKNKRKPRR